MLSELRGSESKLNPGQGRGNAEGAPFHRSRSLCALFVHRDAGVVSACLQELEKGQFTVTSDFVLNLAQSAERLRSRSYDVIVVEYPGASSNGSQVLAALHHTVEGTPIIFLTAGLGSHSILELGAGDHLEYVEHEHLTQLPLAVRRTLNGKKLRDELEEARRALRHSQSLYRALADNPSYGIYRCDAEGELLDVNQTLVTMLGYSSRVELLAANQESEIIPNLRNNSLFAGLTPETKRVEPPEMEWRRRDETTLKVRISGRGVYDDHGNFAGHEIIVVDVTEQRTLECQLRQQALSDSMTGLANHRRLFEVLHAEISRSKRTGREFSLLLLDLDGLKRINDQAGHLVGSRALCRLAEIIADCSRSVDTAARHGGDEFAVVLPETGTAAARLVAQRICDLLAEDTEEPALSVSVGVAGYPSDADTIGTLLYAADRALYAMKSKKPNSHLAAYPANSPAADSLPGLKSEMS
jgi:diguanylate cyclase (GGDEF)-like protein/PAS domain S-box-containing protein